MSDAGSPTAVAPVAHFSTGYRWYVVLLLMASFAFYAANRVVLGVLVQPIQSTFGLTDATMGLVGGVLITGTYALGIIPLGVLADRLNRRNLLAITISLWSVLIALSGLTRSIVQFAAAQMLASLNESGGAPAMSSLISDLFPRARRGLPTSVWFSGVAIGSFAGFAVGGYVAQELGWRATLVALGAPCLLIGLLVRASVRETRRGMADGSHGAEPRSGGLRETLRFYAAQKALRHACYALCLSALSFMGPIYWLTAFFQRAHGTSLAETGFILGIIFGVTNIVGGPVGGILMDRLGRRDVRWHGWLGAAVMITSAIPQVGIYVLHSTAAAFAACAIWQLVSTAVSPVNIAIINNLASAQFRALSLSLGFLSFYLIGAGLGSQLIGVSSDWLATRWGLGSSSLGVACLAMVVFCFWAALHFLIVARHLKEGYSIAAIWEDSSPAVTANLGGKQVSL